MKVISVLLAFLNSLMGALLIVSCISASETLGWITTKTGAGILAIYFGILTFKDAVQPISQSLMLLNSLTIVILSISIFVWSMHWSISDIRNTILLFSGSLFIQGLTSILGMES
jgi:hypothetical protein